jgi:hypothetical protein
MRRAASFFVAVGCLAIASSAAAKGKPAPVSCPPDVVAAVAEMCPCGGTVLPNASVQPWRNHGKYVSCVVHFRNALRKSGCFTDDSVRRTLARCAARSTCGKDKVLCCHYDIGMCSDPTPGDMVKAGTCSNDATVACDMDADCTTSSSRIASDATACMADGGVVIDGGGSVCSACPPPPSTTTTTTLP